MTQHIGLPARRQLLQIGQAGGLTDALQIFLSEFLEHLLGLGCMTGAAGQRLAVMGHDLGQDRQQAGPQAVACKALVEIAWVVHERVPAGLQPLAQASARHVQQGPEKDGAVPIKTLGHGRKARQAGTPPKSQQHGFGLVVGMLGQQHGLVAGLACGLGQGLVAGLAGRILGALAGLGLSLHTQHGQRQVQRSASALTVACELIGRVLQAVVHMQCANLSGPALRGRAKQGAGICAAAVGDSQRRLQAVAQSQAVQSTECGVGRCHR